MGTYASVAGLEPHQIWDGVVARPLHGERMTVGILEFEPLTEVPEYRHDNEQLGLVLKGSITIRSGVPHPGESRPGGATVMDVVSPVRSDWKDSTRLAVVAGRWP